jgi:uncharacterized protein YhaN
MIDGDLRPYPRPPVVDMRLTYTCLIRTKELRDLSRNIEDRLKNLENETDRHNELILQEETVLKAVRIEIRQRERLALFSEFGFQ